MSETPTHSAYCPNCVKNVPHFRRVRRRSLFSSIDSVIGPVLELLRIGPWYCLHCERRTIIRRETRVDAIDYRIIDPTAPLDSPEDSVWVRRNRTVEPETISDRQDTVASDLPAQQEPPSSKDLSPETNGEEDGEREQELPVGNFIVDQKSLVVRSQRLLRFSEKYRDSVIEKILAGDLTIHEARGDRQVSEAEIISWIADRMQRLEAEVEQAKRDAVPELQVISDRSDLERLRRMSR